MQVTNAEWANWFHEAQLHCGRSDHAATVLALLDSLRAACVVWQGNPCTATEDVLHDAIEAAGAQREIETEP